MRGSSVRSSCMVAAVKASNTAQWELRSTRQEPVEQYQAARALQDEIDARQRRLAQINAAWNAAPPWLRAAVIAARVILTVRGTL